MAEYLTKQVIIKADGTTVETEPQEVVSDSDVKDAATITVTSTKGTTFKASNISTILQVSVFQPGGNRIEDISALRTAFGTAAHIGWRWRRDDSDEWKAIVSTDSRISNDGFWLTVSADDVNARTSFEATMDDGK